MTTINPGQGPLQPSRPLGAKVEAEVKEVTAEAIAGLKAAADGVAASLSKLSDQVTALEASKLLQGPDLDAIRDYLKGQQGADGRAWNPADIAPMYGAPWKPPVDGGDGWNPIDLDPADVAPMYGAPWNPADIAPIYGAPWNGGDGPSIDPADIAPMYGAPWNPVDRGDDGPKIDPADFAPMYGASFPRPLPTDWGDALKPIVGVVKLQDA